MRNFVPTIVAFGTVGLLGAACTGPGNLPEPPALTITSPQRSLQQAGSAKIRVTGTALPNADGVAVEKVLVNDVLATLDAQGNFQALIDVGIGATLITTVARDVEGTEAADTRAVHAGELRPAGAMIDRAIAASLSAESFARIAGVAGPLIQGMDIGGMLAPMQPMIRSGDPANLNEEDCLFARGFIHDVDFADIQLGLVPQQGGIAFRAQIDNLDVPGHARYGFSCVKGTTNFRVKAQRVVVEATLLVSPDGAAGFATDLVNENVAITGLDIQASGIPGDIIDMLDLDTRIQGIIARGAEMAMKPLMNSALGALGGPQELNILDQQLQMQMAPADVTFDPAAGVVVLDMQMQIAGAENAKYIYTPNGTPDLDAAGGFQLGVADDLANQMLSQAAALGALNFTLPKESGIFDALNIEMDLPPMISADPGDGTLKLVVGDMMATFTKQGTPVAKAAINAQVAFKIATAINGYGVALELGEPELHVTTVDDIGNSTGLLDEDLAGLVESGFKGQIEKISKLLVAIPLPQVAGLRMRDLSLGSADGYIMMAGKL